MPGQEGRGLFPFPQAPGAAKEADALQAVAGTVAPDRTAASTAARHGIQLVVIQFPLRNLEIGFGQLDAVFFQQSRSIFNELAARL